MQRFDGSFPSSFIRLPSSLRTPTGELAPLFQHAKRAPRGGHQQSVSARNQALDVASIGMGMAARHIMLLADLENAIDGVGHHGVVIVSGMAQLLTEIPFANENDADAGNLLKDSR